jgi:hypothetical protein
MGDRQRSPSTPTRRPAAASPQPAPAGNAAFLAPPGATSLATPTPGLPPLNPNLPAIPPQPWYSRLASVGNDIVSWPIDQGTRLVNRGQAAYRGWTLEEEEAHDADVDQARKAMQQRDQVMRDEEARRRARPNPTTPPTTPVVPGPRAATPPRPGGPPVPGAPGYVPPAGAAGSAPDLQVSSSSGILTFNMTHLNLDLTKMSAEYSFIPNFCFPVLMAAMATRESGNKFFSFNTASSASGQLQYTNITYEAVVVAAKKYKELLKPEYITEYNRQREIYENDSDLAALVKELPNSHKFPLTIKVNIDGKEILKINPEYSFFPFYFLPRAKNRAIIDPVTKEAIGTKRTDKRFFIDCRYYPDEIAFIIAYGGEMLSRFSLIQDAYKLGGVKGIFPVTVAVGKTSAEEARAENLKSVQKREESEAAERARIGLIDKTLRTDNERLAENPITFPYYLFYVTHFAGQSGSKWVIKTDAFLQAAKITDKYQWTDPAVASWDDQEIRPEIHLGTGYGDWFKNCNLDAHPFLYTKRYSKKEVQNKVHENSDEWRKGWILSEEPDGERFFFACIWKTFVDKMKEDIQGYYKKAYTSFVEPTKTNLKDSPLYMVPVGSVNTPNAAYLFANYSARISNYYSNIKPKIQEAIFGKVYKSYQDALGGVTYERFVDAPVEDQMESQNIEGVLETKLGNGFVQRAQEDSFNFFSIYFGMQGWGTTPSTSKEPFYYQPEAFKAAAPPYTKIAGAVKSRYSGANYQIIEILNPDLSSEKEAWKAQREAYNTENPGKEGQIGDGQLLGRYINSNGAAIPIEVIPKKKT